MKRMKRICCGTGKFAVNPGGPNLVGAAAMGAILSGAAAAIGCRRNRFGERSMIVGTPKEIKNHEYRVGLRSEEHTYELQSLMRSSYAVFCLTKKQNIAHLEHILTVHSHIPILQVSSY